MNPNHVSLLLHYAPGMFTDFKKQPESILAFWDSLIEAGHEIEQTYLGAKITALHGDYLALEYPAKDCNETSLAPLKNILRRFCVAGHLEGVSAGAANTPSIKAVFQTNP